MNVKSVLHTSTHILHDCGHPWVSPPRRASFRWWMPLCSTVKHLSIVFMIMVAQITAIFLFIGFPLLTVGVVINNVMMADIDPTAIYQSKNSLIICTYNLGINITTAAITDSRGKPNAERSSADFETASVHLCLRLKNWVETGRDHTYSCICYKMENLLYLFSKCIIILWLTHPCFFI